MIDLKKTFKEFLIDISVCEPLYPAVDADNVYGAPTVTQSVKKGSVQITPIFRTFAQIQPSITASGFFDINNIIYLEYNDVPIGKSYFIINGKTYVSPTLYRNIGSLNDIIQIIAFSPKWQELDWNYTKKGTNVAGTYVDGVSATLDTSMAIWDIDLTPFEYKGNFEEDFNYKSDMMIGLTHPESKVPPDGASCDYNGTKLKVLHRSYARHETLLGYVFVLARYVS